MSIIYRQHGIGFEWDERKAHSNVTKHGVTFEEATEAFFDPYCQYGDASTYDEQRDFVIGYSESTRLLLVVHVERGSRIRIISARLATVQERKQYEEA